MATAKKKVTLNQAASVIGIVAGVLTIGLFVHAEIKKAKEKKEKGVNGAEQNLLIEDPSRYHPFEELDFQNDIGINSLEMSDVDTDISLF